MQTWLRLSLPSRMLYPTRQWTPLFAEPCSQGSYRIHLTFDYITNTKHLVSNGENCTPLSLNFPASDEAIRPFQPESLTTQSDITAIPTTTSPELSEVHFTTPILQQDSAHEPTKNQRFFLDLFAGHSAPLTVAAKAANLDHFVPFDFEFNHLATFLMTLNLKISFN